MKLLTNALRKDIPALYSSELNPDPMVVCKFFTPDSNWTWFVVEGQPEIVDGEEVDFTFFGLVHGLEQELGYFSLQELESVKGPLGLRIERDLYFKPCKLSNVR